MGGGEDGGESQVSNSDLSIVGVDKDIVAFDVSVDHRRIQLMQVL
jgi:hypothetical protein